MREGILEEAYEVIDALDEMERTHDKVSSISHVKEELGDLLFNVLMISYMFEQNADFSVSDMLSDISEKIVRRHPHVFGKTAGFAGQNDAKKASTPDEVLKQWDKIKASVEHRDDNGILASVVKSFPAILKANKMQKKMSKVGFDFSRLDEVRDKVSEELGELDAEIASANLENLKIDDNAISEIEPETKQRIESELGDVFFATVNLARALRINPELALNATNEKFARRVSYMEEKLKEKNLELSLENLDLLCELWEEAKTCEK